MAKKKKKPSGLPSKQAHVDKVWSTFDSSVSLNDKIYLTLAQVRKEYDESLYELLKQFEVSLDRNQSDYHKSVYHKCHSLSQGAKGYAGTSFELIAKKALDLADIICIPQVPTNKHTITDLVLVLPSKSLFDNGVVCRISVKTKPRDKKDDSHHVYIYNEKTNVPFLKKASRKKTILIVPDPVQRERERKIAATNGINVDILDFGAGVERIKERYVVRDSLVLV